MEEEDEIQKNFRKGKNVKNQTFPLRADERSRRLTTEGRKGKERGHQTWRKT